MKKNSLKLIGKIILSLGIIIFILGIVLLMYATYSFAFGLIITSIILNIVGITLLTTKIKN